MTDEAESFLRARNFLIRHREDYAAAYAGFEWPRPERFNWALDFFDMQARGNDQLALWVVGAEGGETRLTYRELAARSNRTANFLRACGVRRGDRVLLMLGNVAPLWEIMLAAMKLGAVISPATTLLSTADLQDRIARGGMRHVIADAASTSRFAGIVEESGRIVVGGAAAGWREYTPDTASETFEADGVTQASDPMLLYFTSGTTAKPKLVLHTHASYPIGHLSTMYWIGLKPGDIHLNISSPGWAKHAWSCFFAPLTAGACVFIYNSPRFDARHTLATLVRCGVTTLCAPPTVWRAFILEDLKSYQVKLRELIGAGEPLNPEVIERVRAAWGLTIRDGYGQTETTCLIGNSPGQAIKPGSMGRPMPGYRISLLDGSESEGEVSVELQPRPVGVMAGYLPEGATTAKAPEGFAYRTSDIAQRDAEGYYTYVGRTDDVFKSSDYRLSPFELESALLEHPYVAEAAVVPSPDERRLSVPKAFVMLKPGVPPSSTAAQELFAFVRKRLAPYQRIRRLAFTELPKTVSGKIRRVELRQAEAARRGARASDEYREEDFHE